MSEKDTVDWGRGWHFNFTQAPNELFSERCTLKPIQTIVYLYLLSCVNQKRGTCISWPSYSTIAKCTRISRRGAQDAISLLIDKNYIYKKNRVIEEGLRTNALTSNMYLINHPAATKDFTL